MNYYKILPCQDYEKINHEIWCWVLEKDIIDTTVEFWNPIIDAGVPHDVVIGPTAIFPRVGLQCQLYNEPENL